MRRLLFGLVAYALVSFSPPLAGEAAAAVHRVGKGESLSRISRNNGCTIAEIQSANDLGRKTVIYPGQRLLIPTCDGKSQGEAKKRKKKEKKEKKEKKKKSRFVHHRVSKGESLSRIAKRYDCTPAEIRASNRLRGNMIYPGMDLLVPSAHGKASAVEIKKGQSVGRPHRGSLHSGVQLPFDRAYYRRRTARAYGASHTIAYLRQAITSVRARYPKIHRLAIGDLSHAEGGALPGHRSHQSGRD
ncbi:MAG TPA: LysM peptidoglycan-binding domain-containing protein, partial [Nannocystis exedens]|nr:LysM peptidoglycan-binding domain-containing protein [Nannocystis exedens]